MPIWLPLGVHIIAIVATLQSVFAQENASRVTGIVYDSLTLAPLPYVTVVNETTNQGTTTDELGAFRLRAGQGDTILFTMLGYTRKRKVLRAGESTIIIFLREFALTLQPVVIYGNFKPHGSEMWKSAINPSPLIRNPAGPGSGYVVETFGPGITLGGLITSLTKSEKEKKKLKSVREKAKQSETYLSVIVSDETKAYFQKTFGMADDDYGKLIESFNILHPEAVFIESKEEIMSMLVAHAATRK